MMIMHIFAAKKTSWHKRAKPARNRVKEGHFPLMATTISISVLELFEKMLVPCGHDDWGIFSISCAGDEIEN